MDAKTILLTVIALGVILLVIKKFAGGCCGGKKGGEGHEHKEGGCCKHQNAGHIPIQKRMCPYLII